MNEILLKKMDRSIYHSLCQEFQKGKTNLKKENMVLPNVLASLVQVDNFWGLRMKAVRVPKHHPKISDTEIANLITLPDHQIVTTP